MDFNDPLLRYTVDDLRARILFAKMAGRFEDFSVPFGGVILRMLRAMVRRNFESGGSLATPAPWAALAPSTLKRKVVRKGILRVTDRLFNSLVGPRRTADSIVEVGKRQLVFGTAVPYARYHQFGTRVLPVRQPLPDPAPESIKPDLRRALLEWILEGRGA